MKQHPLKIERELRGWSQAKVAEALQTTVRTISRWEQGQALPYPFYREQLCTLFDKDARQLGLLPELEEEETQTQTRRDSGLSLPANSSMPANSSLPADSSLPASSCPSPEDSLIPQFSSQASLSPSPSSSSLLIDPTLPEALGSASGLLGREHVLREAKQPLFEKGRLALYGLPGIGKTALAVTLATDPRSQARFQDGVLWAGLGPQPDLLGLLVRWGKLLGIRPSEVENTCKGGDDPLQVPVSLLEDWRRALRATIGQRSLLLVIDDAWSINDALVLLVGGPQCAYLLTTRQPQVAFAFAPERAIPIHELSETEGLALLARFVPQLVQQEIEEARALVREVSGLPLALTLMGRYLSAHFLPGQPHRIRRALAQLHQATQRLHIGSSASSSSTHHLDMPLSLYAAIAISAQRLSPPAQRALCALSVFPAKPASFTEEAALAVVGIMPSTDPVPSINSAPILESVGIVRDCGPVSGVWPEPIELLDELWDAGLLESNGPGRYCLHQTIVNYAQMQGENSAAQQRLVRYIVTYIKEHEQNYDMLEREANVLWAATEIAERLKMYSDLVQGVVALVPFMHVRGLYSRADLLLQQALRATLQLADQLARTIVLYHLADFADLRGDYSHVEIYAQQGLELAKRLSQQDLESGFLYLLGCMWRKRGDYVQAKRLLEEGLSLARQLNNLERICHLLNGLGTVLHYQGDPTQALTYYAEALALARQTESPELVSCQLASLSALEQEQGHYAQAEAYSKEGIQLAWQVGYQEQLCFHLNTLGLIAVEQGAYSQAEAYYLEALAQARQIGHRAHICTLLTHLGELSALRGNYRQTERYCQEGVELARQIGLRQSLAALQLHLGYAIGQQGETYHRANACFEECHEILQQLRKDVGGMPDAAPGSSADPVPGVCPLSKLTNKMYVFWGELHLKYHHLDAATTAFNKALRSVDVSEQDPTLQAQAQYGLARIAALQGAITEAHSLGEDCATTLEKLGHSKTREVRQWLTTISASSQIV
jgi:tetratricopeptide (TPR) repeat protein/transcriptional regulator with XRE-family HTH domain